MARFIHSYQKQSRLRPNYNQWDLSGAIFADLISSNKEEASIARRPTYAPPEKKGPRVNEEIDVAKVRLIDENGDNHGVVVVSEAIVMAQAVGLDLLELSPNANPPVCKILDHGKFKYEEQKRKNEARKKQKTIEVKEIKFRPNIEDHDYGVKMRSMLKFLEDGDKVKVTLRFRGRELRHQELGAAVLERVKLDTVELAKVEQFPAMEGRQLVMVLAPR